MTIETTGFEGLLLLTPSVFADDRGYFFETYNSASHLNAGLDYHWVQEEGSAVLDIEKSKKIKRKK